MWENDQGIRLWKQEEKCGDENLLGCWGSDGESFLKSRRAAHSDRALMGASVPSKQKFKGKPNM